MLKAPIRFIMFVSSYAPLLALFAILQSFGRGWPSYICGAVAVFSIFGLVIIWKLKSNDSDNDKEQITLKESHNRDSDVMAYFVTYIVPFAVVDKPDLRIKMALGVFALIIAALYLRSSDTYVNPFLLLSGLHIYDAVTSEGLPITLLTRQRYLRQEEKLWAVILSPKVYLERKL